MLFDVIVTANVTKKGDENMIQEEIAGQQGFVFNDKSVYKRGSELCDRIKNKHKILIILSDLQKGIDLEKVGIPFDANYKGCKLLLSSASEQVLFYQMHTQKTFIV